MAHDDPSASRRTALSCAICGKDVIGAHPYVTLYATGRVLHVCRSRCLDAYYEDSSRYTDPTKARTASRDAASHQRLNGSA